MARATAELSSITLFALLIVFALLSSASALTITYPNSSTTISGGSNWQISWTSNASDPQSLSFFLSTSNGKGPQRQTLGTQISSADEQLSVRGSDIVLGPGIGTYVIQVDAVGAGQGGATGNMGYASSSQVFRIDADADANAARRPRVRQVATVLGLVFTMLVALL